MDIPECMFEDALMLDRRSTADASNIDGMGSETPGTEPPSVRNVIKEKKKAKRSRKKQLVQEEERERGKISLNVYVSYMVAAYKGALIPLIILSLTAFQVLQIASNWWMAWANPQTQGDKPKMTSTVLLVVYMALAFGSSWFVFIRAVLVATFGLAAAQKLFIKMLRNIFRAPMSFFDSTPTGRILNRVSVDQSVVDLDIPFRLGGFASTTIQLLGIIGVMSKVTWQVLLLFVPMTMVCLWMQLEIIKLVASQKPIVAAVRVSQKLDIILKNSSQTSVSSACVLKMNCFIIVWKMRQASSVSAEGSTYWALLTTMVLAGRVVLSAEGSSSFCLNTDSEGENYSL